MYSHIHRNHRQYTFEEKKKNMKFKRQMNSYSLEPKVVFSNKTTTQKHISLIHLSCSARVKQQPGKNDSATDKLPVILFQAWDTMWMNSSEVGHLLVGCPTQPKPISMDECI